MCYLSCHFAPGPFPLAPGKRLGTLLKLTHHFIILIYKGTYFIFACPGNFFIYPAKAYIFHFIAYQGKGGSDAAGNKYSYTARKYENKRVDVYKRY